MANKVEEKKLQTKEQETTAKRREREEEERRKRRKTPDGKLSARTNDLPREVTGKLPSSGSLIHRSPLSRSRSLVLNPPIISPLTKLTT